MYNMVIKVEVWEVMLWKTSELFAFSVCACAASRVPCRSTHSTFQRSHKFARQVPHIRAKSIAGENDNRQLKIHDERDDDDVYRLRENRNEDDVFGG